MAVEVIDDLDSVLKRLRGSRREAVQAERNYLENNRERLRLQRSQREGRTFRQWRDGINLQAVPGTVSSVGPVLD